MVSFSKLPYEIKESIFSRIRIRDLYEVSVVSEEWFWLTVTTYNGILSEKDLLIKSLLGFHNSEMQLPTPLLWFQMVKYGNFSDVELDYVQSLTTPFGRLVLENFLESRKPIRSLSLNFSTNLLNELSLAGSESNENIMDSILKCFPDLVTLKLQNLVVKYSCLKISKGIRKVHLSRIKFDGGTWSRLFEDPESILDLELYLCEGLYIDHCSMENLKSLSLHFEETLPDYQMTSILDLIRGHKHLKSVKLVNTEITKEWLNVFGKTIENISLEDIDICWQFLAQFKNVGCFERRVMSFVCSDLTTMKRFTLSCRSLDYHAVYICIPPLTEKLLLNLDSYLSRQVQTITTSDAGPALRDLHMICTNVKSKLLTNCVPPSVKKFKIEMERKFENLSFEHLCKNPQNLEDLEIVTLCPTKIATLPESFTLLTNLKILKVTHVTRSGIQNILQQCSSLDKLSLDKPEKGCFTGLSPSCVCKTIREVNLFESDASLKDLLYLFPNVEFLHLSSHLICPLSMPTAIAKLKLFSVRFDYSVRNRFSNFHDKRMSFALLMDTLDVPCKLFHFDEWSSELILGQSDSFTKNILVSHGYAYGYGFPTRFLEARGIKILTQYKDFREMSMCCPNSWLARRRI